MNTLKIMLSTFFMVAASATLQMRMITPMQTIMAMGTTTWTAISKLSIVFLRCIYHFNHNIPILCCKERFFGASCLLG